MTTVKRKPPLSAKFDILRFLCRFKVQVRLNIMMYNTYMFPLHFMSLSVAICRYYLRMTSVLCG